MREGAVNPRSAGQRESWTSLFNLEGTRSAEEQKIEGDIAQLGERLPCKQEVAGSIPTISTNGLVAQLARAYD